MKQTRIRPDKREFMIIAGKEDCYKVKSIKYKKRKIIGVDEYRVDLRNFHCDCPGFWHKFNCIHVRTVIELLKAKGIGIVWNEKTKSYYTNWDYQEIVKELKNQKLYK